MASSGATLFVQCLEQEGVQYVFGIPGEENLDLLDALRKSSIKLVLTRNEQTAAFMAANYGRYRGKPGVALATLGPGATNLVTGVAYAQLNGLPLVVITGQKPIKKSKQGDFQIIDVVGMMKPITKKAMQIQSANKIPTAIRQAFKTVIAERPGAVHLELPEDIAKEQTQETPISQEPIRRPIVEEKAFLQLVQYLKQAKQPMILIGAGAQRKRITTSLTAFITKYNIPFFESQMGKGVVDERLPQYLGTAALSEGDSIHRLIAHADLLLAIGHDTLEKPTNFINKHNQHTKLVHINYYEAKLDEIYQPDLEIIGDIGNLFWRLSAVELKTNYDFTALYQQAQQEKQKQKQAQQKELEALYANPNQPLPPNPIIATLRELLPQESIVALDNGWYKLWFARNYLVYEPNTLLLDNTFATMGAGLSSGMIAKLLHPEKKVVVVVGDGGLLMNLGDLQTAVELGNDLVVLIMNNHAYGMIKIKQKAEGLEPFSLDLKNPDFITLAKSFGATGMRVSSVHELKPTLERALHQKGVVLVDIPITYPETFY